MAEMYIAARGFCVSRFCVSRSTEPFRNCLEIVCASFKVIPYVKRTEKNLRILWKNFGNFCTEMFNCRQYRREQMMKRKRKDGLTK